MTAVVVTETSLPRFSILHLKCGKVLVILFGNYCNVVKSSMWVSFFHILFTLERFSQLDISASLYSIGG